MILRRLSSSFSAGMGWEFNRDVFSSLKGRDFLDMMDNTPDQLKALLDGAHVLKRMYKVRDYENFCFCFFFFFFFFFLF